MIPSSFEYSCPNTLPEAISLLQSSGENAKILAGGQSLIPVIKLRLGSPTRLIDINRIQGLSYLREEMSCVDPVFGEKLVAVTKLWIDETERYLKMAQDRGYLSKKADPRQVAEFVVMVEEGSFAIVKSLRDKKVYWSLFSSLKQYLDSLSEKPEILVHT